VIIIPHRRCIIVRERGHEEELQKPTVTENRGIGTPDRVVKDGDEQLLASVRITP
jgi:hypothetical protein